MADCNMVGPDLQPVLRIRTTFDRIQIRLMGPDPLKKNWIILSIKFFFLIIRPPSRPCFVLLPLLLLLLVLLVIVVLPPPSRPLLVRLLLYYCFSAFTTTTSRPTTPATRPPRHRPSTAPFLFYFLLYDLMVGSGSATLPSTSDVQQPSSKVRIRVKGKKFNSGSGKIIRFLWIGHSSFYDIKFEPFW